MNKTLQMLLVCFVAIALTACGGGEETEQIECGEGTEVDEAGESCVAVVPECEAGEVHDEELGRCVRAGDSYCAAGTEFDDTLGQCVAEADLGCAENTVEEDGLCVPELVVECGPGTVVHGEECVPSDEICAPGTEGDPCRPSSASCGEGTIFDTNDRVCIPASNVSCGAGTVAQDGQCLSAYAFYDDLADDPDLDMTADGADGAFDLADEGELFSFVGNIDAPEEVGDSSVQDTDVYSFDAEAGQWLRITIFSLGLPEPGFLFNHSDYDPEQEEGFYRLSDIGAGIEVTREVAIPADGTYELTVTNLPQLLGWATEAGGDDWGYVGYVETLATPEPEEVVIFEDNLSGDVRHLSDNFYAVDEMDGVDTLLLLFNTIPTDAYGELQIWTDDTTLEKTLALDDSSLSMTPPADDFYLPGEGGYNVLAESIDGFQRAGTITAHSAKIAKLHAKVLTGGEKASPVNPVSEDYVLGLEREVFLKLCGEPMSQQRMGHMLKKGKPLIN